MKSVLFRWLFPTSVIAIFLFGYLGASSFQMVCALCTALFVAVLLRLSAHLGKSTAEQEKCCMPVGFFMLIPSLGMIGCSIHVFFKSHTGMSAEVNYCTIIFAGIIVSWLLYRLKALWSDKSLIGRFARLVIAAALSAPVSLIVVLLLSVTGTEDTMILNCMTTAIFGGASLLIAINMILVSSCGYKSTVECIRIILKSIRERKLIFTRVSIVKDIFLIVGKLVISFVSTSFFLFANALYSCGMGLARYIALKMHSQPREKQIANYRLVGIIISIASICYVIYSARLFFGGKTGVYSLYIALIIAMYTFVEFGINIRDAFRLRKSKALEAKALRAVSFASTLLCFVLTQTAIMSFAAEGDSSIANALSGVVFGGLAALTGLFVIMDSRKQTKSTVQ